MRVLACAVLLLRLFLFFASSATLAAGGLGGFSGTEIVISESVVVGGRGAGGLAIGGAGVWYGFMWVHIVFGLS